MKCARCDRVMIAPAVRIGKTGVGPKCAKIMGLELAQASKPKKIMVSHSRSEFQLDLFEDMK